MGRNSTWRRFGYRRRFRCASVVGSTLSVTESLMTASQVLPRQGRAAFLGFLAEVRAARRAAIMVDRGAPRP
jgi:hypothetical protein